ncbi:ATP-grasp domain-containing protein [Sphingomicrobium sp. XHP0239]|uniref:ATP-grasp domain-containing protein n=1 Tax=Sphingomicrobium maritimum TaxID=3133972 RepID=UPI0031CC3ECC
MITVLVTGAGALLGQGIIRSLKRGTLDVKIVAVDPSPLAPALYWVDEAYGVPMANDADYLPRLREVIGRCGADVLIPGTDVELEILSEARAVIEAEQDCKVLVSSPEVVRIADDKYATAAFFRDAGFDYPGSAKGEDGAEIDALVEKVGFPLIVKPRVGARSIGVSRVTDRAQLDRALDGREGLVVQECVGGDEAEYTASALVFDGQPTVSVVMRRDLRDGNTYRAFTEPFDELHGLTRRWGEALGPYGPANFQFRLDAEGRAKVFEINGRFSGTTPLRQLVGFDEVEMCLRHLVLGEDLTQPVIEEAAILRHWSETKVSYDDLDRFDG